MAFSLEVPNERGWLNAGAARISGLTLRADMGGEPIRAFFGASAKRLVRMLAEGEASENLIALFDDRSQLPAGGCQRISLSLIGDVGGIVFD